MLTLAQSFFSRLPTPHSTSTRLPTNSECSPSPYGPNESTFPTEDQTSDASLGRQSVDKDIPYTEGTSKTNKKQASKSNLRHIFSFSRKKEDCPPEREQPVTFAQTFGNRNTYPTSTATKLDLPMKVSNDGRTATIEAGNFANMLADLNVRARQTATRFDGNVQVMPVFLQPVAESPEPMVVLPQPATKLRKKQSSSQRPAHSQTLPGKPTNSWVLNDAGVSSLPPMLAPDSSMVPYQRPPQHPPNTYPIPQYDQPVPWQNSQISLYQPSFQQPLIQYLPPPMPHIQQMTYAPHGLIHRVSTVAINALEDLLDPDSMCPCRIRHRGYHHACFHCPGIHY
jgi:hypothetical protein